MSRYIHIDEEVFTKLHLSGNDAIVYAIVKAFSSKGSPYICKVGDLAKSINLCEAAVRRTINRLVAKGIVEKTISQHSMELRAVQNTESNRYNVPTTMVQSTDIERYNVPTTPYILISSNNISNNITTTTNACVRELGEYWNEKLATAFNEIGEITDAYPKRIFYATKAIQQFGIDKCKEAIDKVAASTHFATQVRYSKITFDRLFSNIELLGNVLEGTYDDNDGKCESLGNGEYIVSGRRTYGNGSVTVPMDAPKRPSASHIWSSTQGKWIYNA